jgi:anaphase-promoting complex subunit 8
MDSLAAKVLIESLRAYEFNWSAWMELASFVTSPNRLAHLETLLHGKFTNSIIKGFFLANLYTELHQTNNSFKSIMEPINVYFARSPYVMTQFALSFFYTQSKAF